MQSVLCIGIATLDYVYKLDALPTRAEKYRARDVAVTTGGCAGNAAVAIARLGGRARLVARLGDDRVGDDIVGSLTDEGVDCSGVVRIGGQRSPVSAILVDAAGERTVISYSDPRYPAAVESLPAALPPGTGAVLGDTRWQEGAARIFTLARAAGVPAVFDVDRAPDHPGVLEAASHIAFSAQALRERTGLDDPREGLGRLAVGLRDSWLAVTTGEGGVFFIEDGKVAHEPAFTVDVVDTLGAGDVWHGALALALAEGMAPRPAVRFANATAAIKCTRFGGGRGAPSRAEVERLLQS
ncbi:sulfofructose kinase [Chelatococcus caeni]|uniref:Sulfofructose kinase n=1 Tax=Chelatococcus caeni TaxID=1348468 RepID=A0A840BWA7_9HYPH|nr:PfkB family carbohydrate kinase [Chelatococcus caeni]MBB4015629.1 sulfofructose kinase [Chelatococcus caeni]